MALAKSQSSGTTKGAPKTTVRVLSQKLIEAAGEGDVASIKKLAAKGDIVNRKNAAGETALSFAAAWNQPKAVKLLLELGADPNIPDKTGGTALMLAVQHGSRKLVELLLEAGADATAKDKAGNTVMAHVDWRSERDQDQVRAMVRNSSHAKLSVGA